MTDRRRRRWWLWLPLGALAIVLVVVAVIAIPILAHRNAGISTQPDPGAGWPTTVAAVGDDGRERTLTVSGPEGDAVDTSALAVGQRVVVAGAGFDAGQGIYVALCVLPDSPAVKPGPCIGGVPTSTDGERAPGSVDWAPSNWINDDWAWRLFGARPYDDAANGSFTAYLEVGDPVGEGFDCRAQRCGIVTRNDHTAAADRVQDVYIPVGFAR